jgi:hypothetical protein
MQAVLPALAGAVLEVAVELRSACAISVLPASSVTTTSTVKLPEAGATTVALVWLAGPEMLPEAVPLTTDQA